MIRSFRHKGLHRFYESILKGGRVVFNIGGNKYRLVAAIDYGRRACFVKFIGTHGQYDDINVENV